VIVNGYHGTTRKRAEDIAAHGFTRFQRSGLWLGFGRYFFQDGHNHARRWANFVSQKRQIHGQVDPPVVVHADLDLGNCLDLTDCAYWPLIEGIWDREGANICNGRDQLGVEALLRTRSAKEDELLGVNVVDCELMNIVIQFLNDHKLTQSSNITSVRCAFIEGRAVHQTSWLFDEAHISVSMAEPGYIRVKELEFL
jgi:hypothetical protein